MRAAVAKCVALRAFNADAIENVLRNAPLDLPSSRLDLSDRPELAHVGNGIRLAAGKTHLAIGLAREERRNLRLEASIARTDLIVVDELGYLPLDKTGAEHLFGFFSRCYEQCSLIITTNLPFADWPNTFAGDARLAGALIDRLTHRIHVIEMCGESYRLRQSLQATSEPTKSELTKTKPSDVNAKSSSKTPEPPASRRDSQERPNEPPGNPPGFF